MSIGAMNRVWESSKPVGKARMMLLALADSANDDMECWPSIIRLAKKCAVSPRSAQRLLHTLEDDKFITITCRRLSKRRNDTNCYLILESALDRKNAKPVGVKTVTQEGVNIDTQRMSKVTPQPSSHPLDASGDSPPKKRAGKAQAPRPAWVEIYHSVYSRYPRKETWATVAEKLGDDFDAEKLRGIFQEWALHENWNHRAFDKMLAVYRDGWREPSPRGANGNGAGSWSNTQPAGASLPKIRRITA